MCLRGWGQLLDSLNKVTAASSPASVPLHSDEGDSIQQISVSQPPEYVLPMTCNINVQVVGLILINRHSFLRSVNTVTMGRQFYTSVLYKLSMEEE
jgi:hypothetical protein